MPRFKCDECDEKFSSREKRNNHLRKVHDKQPGTSKNKGSGKIITKQRVVSLVGGFILIGMMFGGVVFWADLGPEGGNRERTFIEDPPTGLGGVVEEGERPQSYILNEPLPKEQQVYLLLYGGTRTINLGQNLGNVMPSVLLQHNCENCSEEVQEMEQIAEDFNQDYRFVYVAPYPEMDEEFTLTGFQQLTTYEDIERETIEDDICRKLGNEPVFCMEDVFGPDEDETEQE